MFTAGLTFSWARWCRFRELLQKCYFSTLWGRSAPAFYHTHGCSLLRRFMGSCENWVQKAWPVAHSKGHTEKRCMYSREKGILWSQRKGSWRRYSEGWEYLGKHRAIFQRARNKHHWSYKLLDFEPQDKPAMVVVLFLFCFVLVFCELKRCRFQLMQLFVNSVLTLLFIRH